MSFDPQERERDFEPLPPTLVKQEVIARDVRLGDWMVLDPTSFGDRRDWVQVAHLEMDATFARFKAGGRNSIQVPIDRRMMVLRALTVCSVRKYVGDGRDRHSVDVCTWHAGHDGKHEWEYGDEDGEEEAVASG